MYNLTNVTNATTTYDQFAAINEATGGIIAVLVLIMLFVIMLLFSTKRYDFKKSLFGASFLVNVVGMLFFLLGWLTIDKMIVPFILLGASTVMLLFVD